MRDSTRKSYMVKSSNGKTYLKSPETIGSQIWKNLTQFRATKNHPISDAVDKIRNHPMFPYIKIGHMIEYVYLPPTTKDLKTIQKMKLEALSHIIEILNSMEKA